MTLTKGQFDRIASCAAKDTHGVYGGSAGMATTLAGVTREVLEPYRAELERALEIPSIGDFGATAQSVLDRPHWYTQTIPRFFAWMRDEKLGPWKEETPRLPNGYHIGDIVRIGPLGDQECEVVANPTYGERDRATEVWHENPHYGPTHCYTGGATLVSCPHVVAEPITIPGTAFHVGDRVRWTDSRHNPATVLEDKPLTPSGYYDHPRVWTDVYDHPTHTPADQLELEECPHVNVPAPTDRNLPSHYIPWGPDHPDWVPFWEKADKLAEALGVCATYDRFVQHMGGPERTSTIIVSFTVPRSMADRPVSELVTLRSGTSDLRKVERG